MEMRIFLQTYYRCMKIKIPNFNFYRQVLWFNKENTCRWCFVLLLMSEENKLEAIMNAKWRGRSCVKPSLKKQWTWAANMLFLFEIDYHFCNFESMLHVAWNLELKHARLLWIFNTVCCEVSPVRCQLFHRKTIVVWAWMKTHDVSLLSIGQILPLNLCFQPFRIDGRLNVQWLDAMPAKTWMAPVHIFLWLVWKTAF